MEFFLAYLFLGIFWVFEFGQNFPSIVPVKAVFLVGLVGATLKNQGFSQASPVQILISYRFSPS
jgi:hypothetical protein